MNIIQLTRNLGNGGAEKFIVELSNEQAHNHEAFLYTFQQNEPWMIPPTKLHETVQNRSLNLDKKFAFKNFIRLFKLLKTIKPQVVHVHSSVVLFNVYLLPLFFKKIVFVHTIHSTLTNQYIKVFNTLSKIPFVKKKWIHICISKNILKDYLRSFSSFTFHHIDNGIAKLVTTEKLPNVQKELDSLSQNNNSTRLLAIGNYSDFKRFDFLVETIKELNAEGKNLELFIIGEEHSNDQSNYKKIVSIKTEQIHLLGLRKNVADYMQCSDALIMSSLQEGMPLVIIEAMCVGLPVISTPAGGVVNMIKNKENGFISNGFTKELFKKAIIQFLQSPPEKRKQIKINNIEKYTSQYSIEYCSKEYVKLYQS